MANERIEIIKTNADKGYYELVIPDVQQEDAGTYKCIASNIHGEVESEGVVSVTGTKYVPSNIHWLSVCKNLYYYFNMSSNLQYMGRKINIIKTSTIIILA